MARYLLGSHATNPHNTARARLKRARLRVARTITTTTQYVLDTKGSKEARTGPLIIAHRGNRDVAPENTLPAFASAIAAGVDYIEMDVVLSKDGVAMVIHDETLQGTTNGNGKVSQLTAHQIQFLDAGAWFSPAFAGTRVPTFTQFAELMADKVAKEKGVQILLEFKGDWTPDQVRTVTDIATAHKLQGRTVLKSFSPTTVRSQFEVAPHWRRGVLTYGDYPGLFELCQEVGATMLNPDILEVAADPTLIAKIHHAGMQAMVWTANDVDHWELLLDLGADGFITDRPQYLAGWLAGRKSLKEI